MKTVFKLTLLLALIIYLVVSFVKFSAYEDHTTCSKVNFTIADSSHAGFITADEADRLLRQSAFYPIGREMSQVDGAKIEATLRKNSFIDSVSCYKSPNGELNVIIMQRLPLMRILTDNGEDYYIDAKGNTMAPQGYVADLIVATGHIDRRYARRELTKIGTFLRDNEFWNNQIEQIDVSADRKITLVPRVGGHLIEFGSTDSIARKFQNLYAFYQKVLPVVGWNKYGSLSVEHVTQVVATRKKAKG